MSPVQNISLTYWPFHIEHPTRGVLKDRNGDNDQEGFRFSWSGGRNDTGKCWRFKTLGMASAVYWQIPERIRKDCEILYWSDRKLEFGVVNPLEAVKPRA